MCHDRYDIWYRPTETTCLQEQYVPFEAQTTVSFTVNAVPSYLRRNTVQLLPINEAIELKMVLITENYFDRKIGIHFGLLKDTISELFSLCMVCW